jgi:hypothetical protein
VTSQHLPERPSLEQLKKQAKSLLHGLKIRYGFKFWCEMREYVEEHSLSFRAPAAMAS